MLERSHCHSLRREDRDTFCGRLCATDVEQSGRSSVVKASRPLSIFAKDTPLPWGGLFVSATFGGLRLKQGEKMSAFVVEDRTINQVVTWLQQQRPDSAYHRKIKEAFSLDPLDHEDWDQVARAMFELSCRAVRQRYRDADEAGMIPESFTPKCEPATAIQAYKSLRCWLYQCAEGDVPEASILYSIMGEVADRMANDIACSLPDYEKASWG
jgi:hypothetical protein